MIYSKLSNILNDINTVMVPRLCFGCNVRLYRGEQLLCTLCRNQLPLTEYNFNDENPVDRIFYGRIKVEKAAALLFYKEKGIVKNLIHYLKYKNQQQLGVFLGDWWGAILEEEGDLKDIDLVIPVPLHPKKERKRGYNQVTGFAKRIAGHLNAEYRDDLLIKPGASGTQTKKSRYGRSLVDKALYSLSDQRYLEKKAVLLLDDVITTGATMESCGQVITSETNARLYLGAMCVVP